MVKETSKHSARRRETSAIHLGGGELRHSFWIEIYLLGGGRFAARWSRSPIPDGLWLRW